MCPLNLRLPGWRRYGLGVAVVGLSLANNCPGAQLEYDLISGKQTVAQIARIADDKVIVIAIGGDANRDLVFDAQHEILFIIDHGKRSYIQLDNQTIDEAAAVMHSVSQKMGASSEMVTGVLRNLGFSAADDDVTTVATGRQLTVGGYPCVLYRSTARERFVAEVCVADETSLPLSKPEVHTLRRFVTFGSRLMHRADGLLALLGMPLPPLSIEHEGSLPIAVYTAQDATEVRLTKIEPNATPLTPGLPAGYTRTRIPFLEP